MNLLVECFMIFCVLAYKYWYLTILGLILVIISVLFDE